MLNAPKPDAGAAKCTPSFVGAPVSWIRSFLVKTPIEAVAPSPWLGIAGETGTSGATSGVRVLAVAPSSPAEKAGLQGHADRAKANLIVPVDGVPVQTPEKLAEAIGRKGVGDNVKLLVLEGEKLKEIGVTLKAAPRD
jgi:serine protease Do